MKGRGWTLGGCAIVLLMAIACGGGGGGGGSANSGGSGGTSTSGTGGSSGGSTGTTGSTAGTTGGDVAFGTYSDPVITAAMNQYLKWTPRSVPANRDSFLAAVRALAGVQEAGWSVEGDNFWMTLTNGTSFAVADNRPAPPSAPLAMPSLDDAAITRGATVPKAKTALLLNSLGSAFTDDRPKYTTMVAEAGYQPVSLAGTVTDLMAKVDQVGFFYWSAHSGFYGPGAFQRPFITTATLSTDALSATEPYKTMLAPPNAELVKISASQDKIANPVDANNNGKIDDEEKWTHPEVYAVTDTFIRKWFLFSPNSIAFQDSCTSGDARISGAFTDQQAGLFVGWSKPSSSGPAMRILADRLLGANVTDPKETPPQRPFDYAPVLGWMRSNNLDYDRDHDARLVAVAKSADAGILTPSIEFIAISEKPFATAQSYVLIKGMFGPLNNVIYPRKVFVNEQELQIVGGDEMTIKANIPESGPGAYGPCYVTIGDRKSNVVPITFWDLNLKYHYPGQGTAHYDIDAHWRFRMDLHKFRKSPGFDPNGPTEPVAVKSMSTSTASFTSGGSYTEGECTTTWSGSGSTGAFYADAPPNGFQMFVRIDVLNQTFVQVLPPYVDFPTKIKSTTKCPDIPDSTFDINPIFELDNLPQFVLSEGDILKGQATGTTSHGTATLKWELTIAQHPPTDQTKS